VTVEWVKTVTRIRERGLCVKEVKSGGPMKPVREIDPVDREGDRR